jgi:aspartate-semialdehyde dehydrogenase
VILAGPAESTHAALELSGELPAIDVSGYAEDLPNARLRAPVVEDGEADDEPGVQVVAHPAAIAIAMLVRRLHAGDPLRRVVAQVFAPASEHGPDGVEELQRQTVSLLSFQNLPQAVFDTQAAFALLTRYGEEAPVALEDIEARIERHLATLLAVPGDGEGAPMPSLRLVQAPVFHGYSISLWVEFENNPGVDTLEESLGTGLIEVRGPGVEPPNNVGQAGQGGITAGAIQADRNDPEACWFWLVADNVRLQAENALAVLARLV